MKKSPKTEHTKKPRTTRLVLEISPEKYFLLCDGRQVKDYKELAEVLETIGEDMFFYHVNSERNDFANWINDVFNEKELAEAIRGVSNRFEMVAKIYKHLLKKKK